MNENSFLRIGFAALAGGMTIGVPVAIARADKATSVAKVSEASAEHVPAWQTRIGAPLVIPSAILRPEVMAWRISPDGNQIAFLSHRRIWVWSYESNAVEEICPQADNHDLKCLFVTDAIWLDNDHLLAWESQFVRQDVEDYTESLRTIPPSQAGAPPASRERYVVFALPEGNRVQTINIQRDGVAGVGYVVGARDRFTWFLMGADRDLKLFDAESGQIISGSLFRTHGEQRPPAQLAPCSEWFSVFTPDAPTETRGTLMLVNASSGETRILQHVLVNAERPLVTPNAEFLFTTEFLDDNVLWPVVYDTASGMMRRFASDERWAPVGLSTSRGTLIAAILSEVPAGSNNYESMELELPIDLLFGL